MPERLNQRLVLKSDLNPNDTLHLPTKAQLESPDKIIQFGSGALLRGLIDFFINKAQQEGKFKGRAVIVNNTKSGRGAYFNEQDGLFTLCIEGFAKGETVKEYTVNAAISKALPATDHWQDILTYARNPEVNTAISNTTEIGIALYKDDDLKANPPQSFPGKLTAFLYERFMTLGGSPQSGMLILPTELILDNGTKLRDIVIELAVINRLGSDFTDWIKEHNIFCNTLVDRIVPGEPEEAKQKRIEEELGFEDRLLTISEVYRLFAVEGDKEKILEKAPWLAVDEGIIISKDITPYRERKLRILNGGHTISVAAGFLSALDTVYDCMEDGVMSQFINRVIKQEIVPTLEIDQKMATEFADDVLDRFRNPFLNHKLISITLQYTSKMNMRNGLTFKRYYDKYGHAPELMCAGFAAYLMFLRPVKKVDDKYYGEFQGKEYPISDDQASYFYQLWMDADLNDPVLVNELVDKVLLNQQLWEQDLKNMGDFAAKVKYYLGEYAQKGVKATLANMMNK
ncbi:tagaturonate reductase [Catalinimonas niigatensis]|uniref:tagaturonate reductase n=1 Tax=Catalinimonas niigatensis TaxID=1397264 RepID=UPI00266669C8|nr:tagaturonate reductase [Catalinimonas niigatensis]WPP48234.1 tagaturonate reductase [Catalinimonas niigatensis]